MTRRGSDKEGTRFKGEYLHRLESCYGHALDHNLFLFCTLFLPSMEIRLLSKEL